MSSFNARKHALDMALRHHGPSTDFATIFNTADRFAAYLKGSAEPKRVRLNDAQTREFLTVSADPVAFLERVKIPTIDRGSHAIEPYAHQKELVRFFHEKKLTHVTHARQMGVTTCIAAFILWSAMFEGRDRLSLVVSHSMSGSIAILDRVRFTYEALPDHLKIPMITNNKSRIVFDNGCEINAMAASSNTGRGRTISNLYVDQMAFVSHSISREFFEAIYPVMASGHKGAQGRIMLTSTAGDADGMFFDIIGSIPQNGFERLVLPWQLHPGRDSAWANTMRRNIGDAAWAREYECQFVQRLRTDRSSVPSR